MQTYKSVPSVNDSITNAVSKTDAPLARYESTEYEQILQRHKQEFEDKWNKRLVSSTCNFTIANFEKFRTLGTGSFGTVILVQQKSTNKFFAIKILDKTKCVKQKQVQHLLNEKHILSAINFPFAIFMEFSFKDYSYIYFVLPFVNGGEMFSHLRRKKRFDEDLSKFYAAQVLLTLEYLHEINLVYRDLKPENILIDKDGYLKITDFGFCKMVKSRTWSLCGTPEYIAPEIILCKGYAQSADWWSFGILLYEMSAGFPPFNDPEPMRIYEKIVSGKYQFPQHFTSELKDLIRNTLQIDLSRRYGNLKNGTSDFKTHKWFKSINWLHIYYRTAQAPFIPTIKGEGNPCNFDIYPEETFEISPVERYPTLFEDF